MAEYYFIYGFSEATFSISIIEMLHHINIAVRCRKELEPLRELLISLQEINSDIKMCREALNTSRFKPSENLRPASVDNWIKKLDMLLQQAAEMVRECTIPRRDLISRHRMSKNISRMITRIKEHRENAASIVIISQLAQSLKQVQQSNREMIASSSGGSAPPLTERSIYIGEPLVLGQDMALARLQELMQTASRIGVFGPGGSGKTLLLKRLFNSQQQVQTLFSYELLLWLTVSQTPSFHDLREDLVKQIAYKLNENEGIERLKGENAKIWVNRKLSGKNFILFLDDVWETSASSLLEELALPSLYPATSKVIIVVSSRDRRVLLQVGVPSSSMVDMQYLTENDSWQLFGYHAFPKNDGNLPSNISEEIARGICKECGGLPLAIKVIAQSMAGVLDSEEWEFTLRKLQYAESIKYGDVTYSLYGRLRLSYDSLAKINISLQLCFLYVAAYPEAKVHTTCHISWLWMGEGLLEGEDQFQIGQTYVNLLADRCLIEAIHKDINGDVRYFRVHDVVYDMARQIAEKEENCFFRAGKCFQQFPAIDSRYMRISLANCSLGSVPKTFRGPLIRSLRMANNYDLQIIPKNVIGSMTSLRLLDLSCTSLLSLPDSIGSLKHLVCLCLAGVPIRRLPNSITGLEKLQVLNLSGSNIHELPSSINKLSSLKVLSIAACKDLQSIPYGVSQLISLEFLDVDGSANAWIETGRSKSKRDLLSINDLSRLKQLRTLLLEYNGATLQEGTLGNLRHVEKLFLRLAVMEKLPADVTAMSKLRKLWLVCPQLRIMELSFCGFQHLGFLSLWGCEILKEVPADLHKIVGLKQLEIIYCHNIEKLPQEFGERGAFPMLEVFSLVGLRKLEELPTMEEAAMPSLKTFTVALCDKLKRIPKNYWNLKSVEKIRVYGCSLVVKEMEENFKGKSKNVETITQTAAETGSFLISWMNKCNEEEIFGNTLNIGLMNSGRFCIV